MRDNCPGRLILNGLKKMTNEHWKLNIEHSAGIVQCSISNVHLSFASRRRVVESHSGTMNHSDRLHCFCRTRNEFLAVCPRKLQADFRIAPLDSGQEPYSVVPME